MCASPNKDFIITENSRQEAGRDLVSSGRRSASQEGMVRDAHAGSRASIYNHSSLLESQRQSGGNGVNLVNNSKLINRAGNKA